jgi:hypothetical protein
VQCAYTPEHVAGRRAINTDDTDIGKFESRLKKLEARMDAEHFTFRRKVRKKVIESVI